MDKVKKRLELLTRMILNHKDPKSEECQAYIDELKMLRELIAAWKAFDGYEGSIDPDDDGAVAREKRVAQDTWD